jgi:hypothetical protein
LGVLTFYIHLAWFVSVPSFFVNWFFFIMLCTCFQVWGKKHGPLVFLGLFLLFFCYLKKRFIYCVHAFEFRARSMTPLFFGSFFFYLLVLFSFVFLYCIHVYQN